MQLLKLLIRRYRNILITSAILGVLAGLFGARIIVEINNQLETTGPSSAFLLFILFWTGYGVFSLSADLLLVKLSLKVIYKLRNDICVNVLRTPYEKIE